MGNRALVLSGGGAKGSFELGVVDYLVNDLSMDFHVICGVSTGALNASMLSHGRGHEGIKQQLERLKDIWFGIKSEDDIYEKGLVVDFPLIISLYNNTPLKEKIEQHIKPSALAGSGKEFRVGVVSLNTGEYISIGQRSPNIRDYILASSAIPVIFPPVELKKQLFVDGGVRNVTPLADAFEALKNLREEKPHDAPDEIYIVLASPLKIKKVKTSETDNIIEILKRSVEILVAEVYADDIKHAQEINEYVEKTETLKQRLYEKIGAGEVDRLFDEVGVPYKKKGQAYVKITVFEPEKEYMDSIEFDPAKIRRAFKAGRKLARKVMSEP